uniref:Microtubule-actin crosslinking factor 1 n=1 Tax=Plectus sambesii TaxID=2011161 RepID=A0A914UVA7_9BILA
ESVQRECSSRESDIDELMMAVIELERVGANAELVDDDATFRAANAVIEGVRERLRALQPSVSACLQAADDVCQNGADILSPEEFHSLRKHRDQLKDANHKLHKHTDVASDRLRVASDVFDQFDAQTSAFQLWMNDTNREISELQAASGDHRRLRECQAKAQSITKDVVSHADQLKALRSLAARIHDELRGYTAEVNALRQNRQMPPLEYKTGQVGATVGRLQEEYEALSRRCDQLHNLHTVVEDLSNRYQSQVSGAKEWLSKLDVEIAAAAKEPTSSDPADIQRQLEAIRALNARMVEERRRLDEARAAGQDLLTAVDGTDGHGQQTDELTNEWGNMEERYKLVTESLQNHANALQALHTQSQGVREGMDDMLEWLGATENGLNVAKPLPLDKEKLAEEVCLWVEGRELSEWSLLIPLEACSSVSIFIS